MQCDGKIFPENLLMATPRPFGQLWAARIVGPIADLDIGAALLPCARSLRAGDEVEITSFATPESDDVREVANFRIVEARDKIRVIQIGETAKIETEGTDERPL